MLSNLIYSKYSRSWTVKNEKQCGRSDHSFPTTDPTHNQVIRASRHFTSGCIREPFVCFFSADFIRIISLYPIGLDRPTYPIPSTVYGLLAATSYIATSAAEYMSKKMAETANGRGDQSGALPLLQGGVKWGLALYVVFAICQAAYTIRLGAIREFGPVIHEFDPYFNFRATEVSGPCLFVH
jgi:hypothetical protein